MANVFCSDHIKRSRTVHWCGYCGAKIPVGSPYLSEHGFCEGEAFSRACCRDCEPLINDFWEYVECESYDIRSDFIEYLRFSGAPHPVLTVEVECPSCGPVRVLLADWEEYLAQCPKCSVGLEPSC